MAGSEVRSDALHTGVTGKAPPLLAVLGLVAACLFWGIGFPLTKAFALRAHVVAPQASDWFIVAALVAGRFFVAGAMLVVVERARPTRLEVRQGIWVGLFSACGLLFQIDGMTRTAASTSAFLTQGYVVVLPIVAAFAGRRLPERRVVVAVLGWLATSARQGGDLSATEPLVASNAPL